MSYDPNYIEENDTGKKVSRTLLVVNDDTTYQLYAHQMGAALANYGRIELPSYLEKMGKPGYFDKRKMRNALKTQGIDYDSLPDQEKQALFHVMKGTFGKDVTVVGLSEEVEKALQDLAKIDKSYAHLKDYNLTHFTGDNPNRMEGDEVKEAFVRDGTVSKGSYLDKNPNTYGDGRKGQEGDEKDLENAIIENRLEDLSPSSGPHKVHKSALKADVEMMEGRVILGLARDSAKSTRMAIAKGTKTLPDVIEENGDGDILRAARTAILKEKQVELEKQRLEQREKMSGDWKKTDVKEMSKEEFLKREKEYRPRRRERKENLEDRKKETGIDL